MCGSQDSYTIHNEVAEVWQVFFLLLESKYQLCPTIKYMHVAYT